MLDYLDHLDYLDYLDCLTDWLNDNLKSRDANASKNISSCWKKSFPLNLFCFCVVKKIPILRRALHHSLSQSTWLVQHTLHITLRFCFFFCFFLGKHTLLYHNQISFLLINFAHHTTGCPKIKWLIEKILTKFEKHIAVMQ